MTDLAGLIERLELASGPDREIDVWLWALSEKVDLEWQGTTLVAGYHGVVGWCDPGKLSRNFRTNRDTRGPGSIPPFTASIDAAVGFLVKVWPSAYWRVAKLTPAFLKLSDGEPYWATVGAPGEQETAHAQTAPIALLIATLRALQASTGEGGGDG